MSCLDQARELHAATGSMLSHDQRMQKVDRLLMFSIAESLEKIAGSYGELTIVEPIINSTYLEKSESEDRNVI